MDATIFPSKLHGTMQVPPSKSMAHRMLICAALADGVSKINNLDYSVDIKATASAMQQLGAQFVLEENSATITGTGANFSVPTTEVDCKESGSTFRLILPIFAMLGEPVSFVGSPRLLERPHKIYADIFAEQNLPFTHTNKSLTFAGPLQSGCYKIDGNVSSQFISGLLFALPLLAEDSTLEIVAPFESRSYVELTRQAQDIFGVQSHWKGENTLFIPGSQRYIAADATVEGDWSQAIVPIALGSLLGNISASGLNPNSTQGDRAMLEILQKSHTTYSWQQDTLTFLPTPQLPAAVSEIDMANCPDLGPVLSAFAAFCKGKTTLVNAGRLRIKESDRIAAMEQELAKLGVTVSSTEDTFSILGPAKINDNQTVSAHNDHRIAMALAVTALVAGKTITITDAQSVSKSWPNFFKDLQKLGAKVEMK